MSNNQPLMCNCGKGVDGWFIDLSYIVTQTDSYKKLEKEIEQLKAELARERKCVDFYASTEAYNRSAVSDTAREVVVDDLDFVNGYAEYCGGKLARETQKVRNNNPK